MLEGTPPTQLLAGKYRLVERLGQGGMGAVWKAEHVQLRSSVAVKLMSPKMLESKTFRARFEREARAAAQLRSRHVVTVYDYGVEADAPYIVMELLEGEDLATRLRRDRRIAPGPAATIVAQIARALDRAHAAGLVHRDLKPANVFLARLDDEEVVKVLDFGIAKEITAPGADGLTGDDEVLGTPTYMSPEQIRSLGSVDLRTDLWSLGIIAYRLITGALPFAGDTGGDLVVRVCTEPAVPPSRHAPMFGPSVDFFFDRALAKDPNHRFGSAKELSSAFEAALGIAPSPSRGSIADIPMGPISTPSIALGLVPPPEVDTSLLRNHVVDRPGDATNARRRGLALAIGAAGIAVTGVVLLVAIGVGRGASDRAQAAGSPTESTSSSALASIAAPPVAASSAPPAAAPSATTIASAPPVEPAPSAAATATTLRPRIMPSKRRKVEIGL